MTVDVVNDLGLNQRPRQLTFLSPPHTANTLNSALSPCVTVSQVSQWFLLIIINTKNRFSGKLKLKVQHSILLATSFGLRGSSDDFRGSGVFWGSLKLSLGVSEDASTRNGHNILLSCFWFLVGPTRFESQHC